MSTSLEKRFYAWVGTPRGIFQLVLLTLGVAVGLAIFMATQRAFFAEHVLEKYPEPSAATAQWAQNLNKDPVPPENDPRWRLLYQLWMLRSAEYPQIPTYMTRHAPKTTHTRLAHTLVAGNRAQRAQAVAFVEASPDPRWVPLLLQAAQRAERWRDPVGAQAFRAAAEKMAKKD